MVPLFSRTSVIVLSMGLILGLVFGAAYWTVSPLQVKLQPEWPPIQIEGITTTPPTVYSSTVIIEPLAQGASYTSTKVYQRSAEFWAYRLESSPFYNYLSRRLAEEAPAYSHPSAELSEMVDIKVRYGDILTSVQVQVFSEDEEEVTFLAGSIARFLRWYLIAEEVTMASQRSQVDLERVDTVRTDLAAARSELAALSTNGIEGQRDPGATRIAAEAAMAALDLELRKLASQLAGLTAVGFVGQEYNATVEKMERVSAALAAASEAQEFPELALRGTDRDEEDPEYIMATARVKALVKELDKLADRLSSPSVESEVEATVGTSFFAHEPSETLIVPSDKIRGRNALVMGGVLGLGIAWLALNSRGLFRSLQRASQPAGAGTTGRGEAEDREDDDE